MTALAAARRPRRFGMVAMLPNIFQVAPPVFARRHGVNETQSSEKALFALTFFIAKSKLKNQSGRKGGEIPLGVFVDTKSKYSYHCVDS